MKFRKPNRNEIGLIENCAAHFKGHFETDKFSLFVDKFNKVFIYNGTPLNLTDLGALSIGLHIGKFEADNTFTPNQEFIDVINPTAYIFEIQDATDHLTSFGDFPTSLENAINFMKGQDIGNERNDYMIYTEKKLNFEENALIALKYKGMVLGVGKFSKGKIINKISKRKKLH